MMQVRDGPESDESGLPPLLARIAAGEQAALKALYDRTAPKLFGIVLRMVRDRSLAEDVLQDVYLRIWQKAGTYEPGAGPALPWLVSVARYRAIDVLRRRTESAMPASDDGEEDWIQRLADPRDEEAETVNRQALRFCLERLEPPQRDCLVLAYCEGLSREELAARYDRPVNTVKTWLHRGLASLRGCLEAA